GGQKSPHGSKQNWDSYEIEGQIRRLTPTECERLQGFPDDWEFSGKKTKAYRQVGNAFPPPVAKELGRQLLEVIGTRQLALMEA
ncbi:MAG: DNA cytosine methyltransferase, partial [Chloroflexi bacterium]|nr:DNA cytosine methyltransferase [Chloroflexota bacterium]